jgi:hypothetical protein
MRYSISLQKLLFFVVGCAVVLAGCESAGKNGSGTELNQAPYVFEGDLIETQDAELISENGRESTPNDYTFSAGDSIDVKFFYTPELNETQDVRPDSSGR